jgi:hypothetical protein
MGSTTADPELESFKALNLGEVAAAYGFTLDRKESSRSSLVMRHGDGDKIVIATGEDGHGVFFSVHSEASGSVVDFVMHRQQCNLGRARVHLRSLAPSSFPTAHRSPIPKPRPIARDRAALVVEWQRFLPYRGRYLESRGLNAATLEAAADKLRTDERGNVLFRHDDRDGLTGWEKKNRGFTGFAGGGFKSLFALRAGYPLKTDPPRVVIAESALDALSFWQLNPAPALLLSLGGAYSPEQAELLWHVLTKYPSAEVLTATDDDAQGDHYAAQIQELRPDAIRARPPAKDWNEALKQPPRRKPSRLGGLACLL